MDARKYCVVAMPLLGADDDVLHLGTSTMCLMKPGETRVEEYDWRGSELCRGWVLFLLNAPFRYAELFCVVDQLGRPSRLPVSAVLTACQFTPHALIERYVLQTLAEVDSIISPDAYPVCKEMYSHE